LNPRCSFIITTVRTTPYQILFLNFFLNFFSMFLQLSSEVSGRGAKTKIRGRLKDKEEEEKIAKERAELVRKDMEAKYARWNKG
jgi:hypothetical protein